MDKSIHTDAYRTLLLALISARKESDITQQELARRLGAPQSFVSKYENGERRLDIVETVRIARHLGLSTRQLIRLIESSLA